VVNRGGYKHPPFSFINLNENIFIKMNFVVYTKDNCPYCSKVKQVLELTESNFVVYNLNEHFTKEQFYAEFGEGSTFPQVICNDQKLGGCIDTIKFLKEQQIV